MLLEPEQSSKACFCCFRNTLLEAMTEFPHCWALTSLSDVLLLSSKHPLVHQTELHSSMEEHVSVIPTLGETSLEAIVLELAFLLIPVVDVGI